MDAGGGLLMKKNQVGLVKPSDDVIKVCKAAERCFQRLLHLTDNALPQSTGIASVLSSAVLHDVGRQQIFVQLTENMLDSQPDHNHVFILNKRIAACYVKIRMYHLPNATMRR